MNALKNFLILCCFLIASFAAAQPAGRFSEAAELYKQKQYTQAFEAFLPLAEQADARAQTIIAIMYKFGEGTEQDLTEAYRWYRTAADLNYPAAQYYTGVMLAEGTGVEQNQVQALEWLTLAANNGFERAEQKIANLNASASATNRTDQELAPWSKNWDLRLPISLVLDDSPPQMATTALYHVQVGAMGTQGAANRLWRILSTNNAPLFANRQPVITLSEQSDRRVYRVQTGPFTDLKAANAFCERLLSSTVQAGCMPLKLK